MISARRRRLGLASFILLISSFAGVAAMRQQPEPKSAQQYKFTDDTVLQLASRLSAESRPARKLDANSPLRTITYDQYRDIRVNPDSAIWRNDQVPMRVEELPAGFLFQTPVTVSIVENGMAQDVSSTPATFTLGPSVTKALNNLSLPLSGFRVRTHLNSRSVWDEFLVFQGASYFRAVAKDMLYGLSARGLAIKTAHPTGEEFPEFTHFWIERPSTNASGIVIHALLESTSTTGAYRFSVTPGTETIMDVDVTLFPRVALDNVGIAPLTSMFLFDESNRARIDDFRDEVHDSDGLQIVTGSGEQIWRPIANPTQLQVSSFTSTAPRGFGLVQRSRKLVNFQDLEAQYERRPSAWIEPVGEWGAGAVQLVEIPSDSESNDNIIAFWRPKDVIPAGKPWHAAYRIRWNAEPRISPPMGRATATRSGPSFDGKRRLFVVDFVGAGRSIDDLKIEAGTSAGKISNVLLQANPTQRSVRASFELAPGEASVAELRLRLLKGDRPVTETWLYRWTPS
ncbi:MAG TPA: glucan biosynthesis protein G [Steroidobacteraceae bacterium]|jgi:glucans biosynthesis protein